MSDSTTLWTVACQAPLSMRLPKQEYWSGLPFPSPGDLPDPGMEPTSPELAGRFFTIEQPGKPAFDKKVLLNYSPESFQGCLFKERRKCYVF